MPLVCQKFPTLLTFGSKLKTLEKQYREYGPVQHGTDTFLKDRCAVHTRYFVLTLSIKSPRSRRGLGKGWDWAVPVRAVTLFLQTPTLLQCEALCNWCICGRGGVLKARWRRRQKSGYAQCRPIFLTTARRQNIHEQLQGERVRVGVKSRCAWVSTSHTSYIIYLVGGFVFWCRPNCTN